MLYKQTTSEDLFEILNTLMTIPLLSDFRLVGGTALSLLLGHRLSIDIDLLRTKIMVLQILQLLKRN